MKKKLCTLLAIGIMTSAFVTPTYAEEKKEEKENYSEILKTAIDNYNKFKVPKSEEYKFLVTTNYEEAHKAYKTEFDNTFPIDPNNIDLKNIEEEQQKFLDEISTKDFSALTESQENYNKIKKSYDETEIYVIENNSSFMGEFKNGNFEFDVMKASNGAYVSLENLDGTNYVPFRYLLEEIACFTEITEEQKSEEQKSEEQKSEEQKSEEQKSEEQKSEEQKSEEQKTENEILLEIIKNEQKPSFLWKKIDDAIHLYITDGENYYYGKVDEILKDKNHKEMKTSNGELCYIKNINNSCYIPLRALEFFGLHIEYCDDTKLIIISKGQKAKVDEINTEYKKLFNNNYSSYSNLYEEGKKIDNSYCANKYGKFLFYVNASSELCYKIDSKENALKIPQISDTDIITFDKIFFSGNRLYGIRTESSDALQGKLFSVKIVPVAKTSLENTTDEKDINKKIANDYELIGTEYTDYSEVIGSTTIRSLIFASENIGGKCPEFIYYIDNTTGLINRINPLTKQVDPITPSGLPISDFNVNEEHLVFTVSNKLYLHKLSSSLVRNENGENIIFNSIGNEIQVNDIDDNIIVRGIISVSETDAEGNKILFYLLIEKDGNRSVHKLLEKNGVYSCVKVGDVNETAKNLTVLNNQVYVKVDGEFKEIKP